MDDTGGRERIPQITKLDEEILLYLQHGRGSTLEELAAYFQLSKTAMVRRLKKLQQAGLVASSKRQQAVIRTTDAVVTASNGSVYRKLVELPYVE
jgi:DNA-binding MarR family transcriptional regulator